MGNILNVSADLERTVTTDPLYQYDYGQRLVIHDIDLPEAYEVHFSNTEFGNSTTSIGDSTGVSIPDIYLTTGKNIYAWIYLHTGTDDGETVYKFMIPVRKRAKITDGQPTPVQQDAITQAIAVLNSASGEAATEALKSEGHATGTQNGEPVQMGSPYYHNNAKYYAQMAGGGAEAIIDDDAGPEVTDRAWSAKKISDKLSEKADTDSPVFTDNVSMGREPGSQVGQNSSAFGVNVAASGEGANATGIGTTASGDGASACGNGSAASGRYSDATGNGTIANHQSQHVFGEYNVSDPSSSHSTTRGEYVEIVGNGASESNRGNARTLKWNGDEHLRGDLYVGSNTDGTGGRKVISENDKGTANGVAELDANGKVPSSQLPSYVDDVVEYASVSAFPATGESGKIYVALDTNKTYRWGGTEYVAISSDLALGETSATAYRGDRGKAAYDHATDAGRATTAAVSGLYKVAVTAEGHVASVAAVQKEDLTALGVDPESIIDDTAGDGDTDKVWSADKSSELLSEINAMRPHATSADIGKALIVKTVSGGKPTSYEYGETGGGASYDQWNGKKWCALGTSITDTSYTNPNTGEVTGKYVPFLATKSGLLVTNRGVAGGRLVGGSGSYDLLSKILSYNDYSTFDIITIEGFVNDWAGNTPLGDLGDTGDTTFYGALYQAINYILSNCHAEVVLITDSTGRQVQNLINCDMWQQNTANLYQQDYNDAIIKTGQFFGIPVIDAGGRSQINKYHTEYLIDNIHHTTLGGEQYAKTIWEELKLLNPAEWKSYHTETGNPVSFETNVAEPMQITAKFVPEQSGSGNPSPTNVRNLSGITGATIYHSDDDTSNPTEYQITFPAGAGTLYAGRIDLTTGVLYADYKCINAKDVTWSSAGATYMVYYKPSDAYTEITEETPNGKTEIFCNVLKYESGSSSSLNYYLVWGGTNNNGNIVVYDKDTANVQAWNNFIQNNDVQICYRLATPVQYQLTAEEVLSIIGENNLWSNLNSNLSVTYAERD